MDKETRDILSINKIKRDAQKKRMGINRKPGESLAAFVTRAKKHKEKMQKEETEEDRIQKHADRINKEKSQGLSKTQHKKAMAAANRIHRQRSMAAKRNEEVELDEKAAIQYPTYKDYVAARKKQGLQVIPEKLWNNLKKDESVELEDYVMSESNKYNKKHIEHGLKIYRKAKKEGALNSEAEGVVAYTAQKKFGFSSNEAKKFANHIDDLDSALAYASGPRSSLDRENMHGAIRRAHRMKKEEVELDEAIMQGSKEHLKKLQGMLDKVKPGSADHSQIRGAIESKFGKQHIPAKHRNVKPDMYEEVELEEGPIKAIGTAFKKYRLDKEIRKTRADREQMIRQSKTGNYQDYAKEYEKSLAKTDDLKKQLKNLSKKEEVELDEISKKTLVNYMDKSKKQTDDIQKKFKKGTETRDDEKTFDRRVSGQIKALDKFHGRSKVPASGVDKAYDSAQKAMRKEEVNLQEDAWEEIPMMKRQLRYIQVASRDIMEYISQCDDQCVDPEEWFQNKLSHIHGQMQSLHAYVEGEHHREDPEYDMEESYDIYEKLEVSDGIEAWIKDFYKSDAPQFKGKDKKERRDMAVAAYLSAKRKKEE